MNAIFNLQYSPFTRPKELTLITDFEKISQIQEKSYLKNLAQKSFLFLMWSSFRASPLFSFIEILCVRLNNINCLGIWLRQHTILGLA